MDNKKRQSVILTLAELKELLENSRRLARIYAVLGHLEDKESVYQFVKRFESREKGERK